MLVYQMVNVFFVYQTAIVMTIIYKNDENPWKFGRSPSSNTYGTKLKPWTHARRHRDVGALRVIHVHLDLCETWFMLARRVHFAGRLSELHATKNSSL